MNDRAALSDTIRLHGSSCKSEPRLARASLQNVDRCRWRLQVLQVIVAFVTVFGWSSSPTQAQEDDEFAAGLIGRYSSGAVEFERRDPAVAFTWNSLSPDPRMAPGPFQVNWKGFLVSQGTGDYRLHVHSSGKVKLKLGDRVLIDSVSDSPAWHSSPTIPLDFDYHPLEITFVRSNDRARIALFWEGPQFQLEPIGSRQLYHLREESPTDSFARGEQLVRALRCEACHTVGSSDSPLAAPSLEHLDGFLDRQWLTRWLTAKSEDQLKTSRRMPHFAISDDDAESIADWLMDQSQAVSLPTFKKPTASKSSKDAKKAKKKDEPAAPAKTPVELGREVFATTGCLACHGIDDPAAGGLFGGGDLKQIAGKRPARFFETWLAAPQILNRHHRMPVFDLNDEERRNLAAFLATLGSPAKSTNTRGSTKQSIEPGGKLVASYRCAACHALPNATGQPVQKTTIGKGSNWERSCVAASKEARQPQYRLPSNDEQAIREYVASTVGAKPTQVQLGTRHLAENNCLACHQRYESEGLAPRLTELAAKHADLNDRIPLVTPPPLNSVGDKLNDATLRDAIARKGPPHRPYLLIRMPRFSLAESELEAVVQEFISADRIPTPGPSGKKEYPKIDAGTLTAHGSRLVTPDGFGCTSCHQVGDVLPVKAPLNARGPDLSQPQKRLRREWYDRWVRNPSRIVPRMEMPSVQIPVRGVLKDDLDTQLAAVWDVLNVPGFQPPLPNPVRIVRQTGTSVDDRAIVITDVLRSGKETYVKPLLIGLSNRHNVLFDLATARLTSWSVGDTARQRTEGKTWFWEDAGNPIMRTEIVESELSLSVDGRTESPRSTGQFLTEFDFFEHEGPAFRFRHRLHFGDDLRTLNVTQTYRPVAEANQTGFSRLLTIDSLPQKSELRLAIARPEIFSKGQLSPDRRTVTIAGDRPWSVSIKSPAGATFDREGLVLTSPEGGTVEIELVYATTFAVDRFLVDVTTNVPSPKPEPLNVVPGFTAERLPLTDDIMPTAMTWRPDGTLVIGSLKGQVWLARDTDGDGLEDRLTPFSDELASPYGLSAAANHVDVINKYALLRLHDDDGDGRADRTVTLASGWGHTADYHDWAVGLPKDEQGNYYVALPCQQDERSPAAARLRGHFLKLTPRQPTTDDPRQFNLQTISQGHRFPMGIARRSDGELFVSDNQGNYNPFNEINHVRPKAHFGFINAIERGIKERPPLTPPAVNLPHPWVRSVNGICFLEAPGATASKQSEKWFGPFAGHMIGCEYDTRRLVRMSVQQVGDVMQGAAYPFSYDQPPSGPPLLGPLTCEVAPDGDLYVGGIRDSGWGGANNIGEVIRLRFDASRLPCGIAEMRATSDGFELLFTTPVNRELAKDAANYSLASYRRESTPAYGGPDLDTRNEPVQSAEVASDSRSVRLRLRELRPGFVYELHVKPLVAKGQPFFPAEAHFTYYRGPLSERQ